MFCSKISRNILGLLIHFVLMGLLTSVAYGQSGPTPSSIDPRLIEIVEGVKARANLPQSVDLRMSRPLSSEDEYTKTLCSRC